MSTGCMDLCTFFSIWDTHSALANCWQPSIFGTLVIFALQCSLMSWSLVSKLKLNTPVLKYSMSTLSTQVLPGGTQILEYSHTVLSKVLIFLAVKALDHPNSLACHNKIDKLVVMIGQLATRDSRTNRQFKPQIHQSRGRGHKRNYNQRNYQNRCRSQNRSNGRDRGQYRKDTSRPRHEP